MSLVSVTSENFEKEVLQSKLPVVVDFWAEWCGPCQLQGPAMEDLDRDNDNVKVVKMNVDEDPELPRKYGVTAIPTMMLFKDGKKVDAVVGLHNQQEVTELLNL